jgi:wyosine [tRNA(Phe)-imidazoG37] synthetase (radical SAM superfamily)
MLEDRYSGLNDTEEAFRAITTALQHIQPDEAHITLPTRLPFEMWVQPTDEVGVPPRSVSVIGDRVKKLKP